MKLKPGGGSHSRTCGGSPIIGQFLALGHSRDQEIQICITSLILPILHEELRKKLVGFESRTFRKIVGCSTSCLPPPSLPPRVARAGDAGCRVSSIFATTMFKWLQIGRIQLCHSFDFKGNSYKCFRFQRPKFESCLPLPCLFERLLQVIPYSITS